MEKMDEGSVFNNVDGSATSTSLDQEVLGSTTEAQFSRDSVENLPTKEDRLFRKAKRTLRTGVRSNSESGEANGVLSTSAPTGVGFLGPQQVKSLLATGKNSRRSRNAYFNSRGQPKKGGAGGKGVWGQPGSELNETGLCHDARDPNYDSDSQEEYKLEGVNPVLSEDQLEKVVQPIILEYFEHGNSDEVEAVLRGLTIGPNKHKVVKVAILSGLDRHNPQRELISRLISDLYSCVFTQEDIARAFSELLANLDDLVLDTPDAHVLLGQFIARCIADDCLPPKFITSYKGHVGNECVKSALEKADVLLSMKCGLAHLDNIWGIGGGSRPVKSLTNKMIELLKEYISSGDVKEATRCLLELEVPHFHHELVFQAGDLAIEDSTERVREMIVLLLKSLSSTLVITANEMEKGLRRLCSEITDLSLDVPSAPILLEQLVTRLHAEGAIGNEVVRALPSRGRKRFVSEGDGGRLKPTTY